MRLLLRSGASPDLPNNNGKTPLNIARERGYHLCEELVSLWKLLNQESHQFKLTFFYSYFTLLPVKRPCLKMSTLTGIFPTMMDPQISLMRRHLKTIHEPWTELQTRKALGQCLSLPQQTQVQLTQMSCRLVTTDPRAQHLTGLDPTHLTAGTVQGHIVTLSCHHHHHLSQRNPQYVSFQKMCALLYSGCKETKNVDIYLPLKTILSWKLASCSDDSWSWGFSFCLVAC